MKSHIMSHSGFDACCPQMSCLADILWVRRLFSQHCWRDSSINAGFSLAEIENANNSSLFLCANRENEHKLPSAVSWQLEWPSSNQRASSFTYQSTLEQHNEPPYFPYWMMVVGLLEKREKCAELYA